MSSIEYKTLKMALFAAWLHPSTERLGHGKKTAGPGVTVIPGVMSGVFDSIVQQLFGDIHPAIHLMLKTLLATTNPVHALVSNPLNPNLSYFFIDKT